MRGGTLHPKVKGFSEGGTHRLTFRIEGGEASSAPRLFQDALSTCPWRLSWIPTWPAGLQRPAKLCRVSKGSSMYLQACALTQLEP